MRHRLTRDQLSALAGRRLGQLPPTAPLAADFRRLTGARYGTFMAGLGDEVPMRRVDDTVIGEGIRPGSLGYAASLFVLGPRGEMFAVVKGGAFGADIEQFGDLAALGHGDIRHRYLEFVDLDE